MNHSVSDDDQQKLANLSGRFDSVHVIISPPRCGSTVLARVFWEQPSVRYYCHEPFERMYYKQLSIDSVFEQLSHPIDLTQYYKPKASGRSLVVKAISFQVEPYGSLLFGLSTTPVLFLIRDPRLSVSSKIRGRQQAGLTVPFPDAESGWESLASQVRQAEELKLPYLVVECADLQNNPQQVLSAICDRWALPASSPTFAYRPKPDIPLDNLNGVHMHFYQRALTSSGIESSTTPPNSSETPGIVTPSAHLKYCQGVYRKLLRSPARVRI